MFVFTLVFANFFDAMGSFTGLARESGLADDQGTFPRVRSALKASSPQPSGSTPIV